MNETTSKTTEEITAQEKAARFYAYCKKLKADSEFQEYFWDKLVDDRLEAADLDLKNESIKGEDLAVARKAWKIYQELHTLFDDSIESYERIHSQTPAL